MADPRSPGIDPIGGPGGLVSRNRGTIPMRRGRPGYKMRRAITVVVLGAIVLAVFLSLRACFISVRPDNQRIGGRIDDSVVALANGSVLIAQQGTISRAVIDWFTDIQAPAKAFDIGWQAFQPNSADPAAESQARLERFADELHAYRGVRAKLVVCTSTSDAAATQLASRRAQQLKKILVTENIEAARISTATCRLRTPGNAASSPSSQDGEIIRIVLEHGR
jgi:hypothetical protein